MGRWRASARRRGPSTTLRMVPLPTAPRQGGKFERVDRGVDLALDLVAFQPRWDRLADLEGHRSAAMDKPAAPQPPAIDCDGNDRKTERAIERGKARLQLRRIPDTNPCAFGIDGDRPSSRCGV